MGSKLVIVLLLISESVVCKVAAAVSSAFSYPIFYFNIPYRCSGRSAAGGY